MRLIWTPDANADVDRIVRYIARDSVNAALRVQDRIEAMVDRLKDMPQVGRVGQLSGTRELVVTRTPYLVIYRVQEPDVVLLRVIHGAQRWPPPEA